MRLLIVLWVAWCALHSLLIAGGVRRWFERRGGAWLGLYRIGYVCFALCSLAPLLWCTSAAPQHPLGGAPPGWLRVVQGALLLYALAMFIGGLRVYDLQAFLGLRQWRDYRAGRSISPPAFRKTGVLRLVRHPWYSGGIALLWALPGLTDVTLVVRTLLSVYLVLGAVLEEHKLREILGEPYNSYCRETPMLVAWKFPR
ncbi:isoprenylcysteine carboxylmethyltransferase family protein [Desulfobulbus sp.]|uniref:methyltransferase family protein n=1 Tax=Desulfobulbus sp. TaxID=895 RepID=UPI0027BA9C52|nr:NnrU family protein [Desulfobulbus sp.]